MGTLGTHEQIEDFRQVPGCNRWHGGYGYVLAWPEEERLWSRDLMDDIEGVLAMVMMWMYVDRGHRGDLGEDGVC